CIRPGERVTFYVGKRPRGSTKFVWVRLGDYPVLTLAEARLQAAAAVSAISEGKPLIGRDPLSFSKAVERYIRECLDGKRTRREIEQDMHRELIPALGNKPLVKIAHDDIVAVLRSIADRTERHGSGRLVSGGPHAARKALVHLRVMLRWCA